MRGPVCAARPPGLPSTVLTLGACSPSAAHFPAVRTLRDESGRPALPPAPDCLPSPPSAWTWLPWVWPRGRAGQLLSTAASHWPRRLCGFARPEMAPRSPLPGRLLCVAGSALPTLPGEGRGHCPQPRASPLPTRAPDSLVQPCPQRSVQESLKEALVRAILKQTSPCVEEIASGSLLSDASSSDLVQ